MLRYSPDLIQRVLFEKENGDPSNYDKVLSEFRLTNRETVSSFLWNTIEIKWSIHPWTKFIDVFNDSDGVYHFYFWTDSNQDIEFLIPGYIAPWDKKEILLENSPSLRCMWVLGNIFPRLDGIHRRPIKLKLPGRYSFNYPLRNFGFIFRDILNMYNDPRRPIFEHNDYDKNKKGWVKIVEGKR